MKKILFVLVLLVIFPFITNAACDENKYKEYMSIADKITYDNSYNRSKGNFTITVYNVIRGMYVTCKRGMCDPKLDRTYNPNNNNEVIINNIKQGAEISLKIFADNGCYQIKEINLIEPYYNLNYGSNICDGYEDKVIVCSSQFTSTPMSDEEVKQIIANYNNVIKQGGEKEKEKDNTSSSTIEWIKEAAKNWGLKIVLVILTCAIFIPFFSERYRKAKHGI